MYFALTCTYNAPLTQRPIRPMPYATFFTMGPALPREGDATHFPHHLYTTRLKERYAAVTRPMHQFTALLNSRGLRISDMTGRKAEVPAPEQKIVLAAVIPAAKVGWPITW